MSLHITLDLGDVVIVGDSVKILYNKKQGRKIVLSFDAEKSIKIRKIKNEENKVFIPKTT